MELKNKKINFLGDSITEGGASSCLENGYVSIFGTLSGAEVRNYGAGGTRIARQRSKTETPSWDLDFVMRADEMDDDADIIVVMGGTNDFARGDAPIGNMESRDVYTFYGALHILCQKLITKYPYATIVFMTPTHRSDEDSLLNEVGLRTQVPLSKYADIIKEVAGYYAFPVLDLYRVSGMQPSFEVIKEKFMPDGLHPNDDGSKRIAERVLGFLRSL